jgi:hypothetical protein
MLSHSGSWANQRSESSNTLKEDEMPKAILVGAILLLASVLLAGGAFQPLNVKTGLWQTTLTTTSTGLPPMSPAMQARMAQMTPEQRAKMEAMINSRFGGTPKTSTYKKCLTKEDLNKNPFSDPDQKCTWTILTSTGSEVEAQGSSCAAANDNGMTTNIHLKVQAVDSENVKGDGQMTITGNGRTMNTDFTLASKWISASCPAEVN